MEVSGNPDGVPLPDQIPRTRVLGLWAVAKGLEAQGISWAVCLCMLRHMLDMEQQQPAHGCDAKTGDEFDHLRTEVPQVVAAVYSRPTHRFNVAALKQKESEP